MPIRSQYHRSSFLLKAFFAITASIVVAACLPEDKPKTSAEYCGDERIHSNTECLSIGDRHAFLVTPPESPQGIAIFSHGSPGGPNKVLKLFDAERLTKEYNLISVAPIGITNVWGWDSLNTADNQSNNDVELFKALIDRLQADYGTPLGKVYLFGFSAGGFMNYKLACQIPERLSAIVSIGGQFRGDIESCPATLGIPMHHLHSPTDEEVPYQGKKAGRISSVEDTVLNWRSINGCSSEKIEAVSQPVTTQSTETISYHFQNCIESLAYSELIKAVHEDTYDAQALLDLYKYLLE